MSEPVRRKSGALSKTVVGFLLLATISHYNWIPIELLLMMVICTFGIALIPILLCCYWVGEIIFLLFDMFSAAQTHTPHTQKKIITNTQAEAVKLYVMQAKMKGLGEVAIKKNLLLAGHDSVYVDHILSLSRLD